MAVFRFMEWQDTITAPTLGRAHPAPQAYTYTDGAFAPLEVMIRLANETGTEPWFTIPHLASDDLIARMAR